MNKTLLPLAVLWLIQFVGSASAEHLYVFCDAPVVQSGSSSPGFQRYLGDRLLDIDLTKKVVISYSHIDAPSGVDAWNFAKPTVYTDGVHHIQFDGTPNPDVIESVTIDNDVITFGYLDLTTKEKSLTWTLNRHTGMLESPINNKLTCVKRNSIF